MIKEALAVLLKNKTFLIRDVCLTMMNQMKGLYMKIKAIILLGSVYDLNRGQSE